MYRQRWSHDKVVRTTHGVNCTGSCSWNVYVKEGIITWEHQAVDYPTCGPDFPEYEPRGCPRGASFSWYEYSPVRIKYPYIRGKLWQLWTAAKKENNDDLVKAWASIVTDPNKTQLYKKARGQGGLVRVHWDEALELIATMVLYTVQTEGPDRLAGFTPIPAMSMISYASGARFLSLVGGEMLSFYDWYADLPPASPQVWGEQTDVPESADWYNSQYLIMWGSNVPLTRTPDAHFMTEARYKGTKVVAVSPDYAENVKFADNWLAPHPGTDAALAQGMTYTILDEFYRQKQTPEFSHYAKQFTDLPFLVTLDQSDANTNHYTAGRFLRISDIEKTPVANGDWKTCVIDATTNQIVVPNGTIGQRWEDHTDWNLRLKDKAGNTIDPKLGLDTPDTTVVTDFPYFSDAGSAVLSRHLKAQTVTFTDGSEHLVTTVYDLMLSQYGLPQTENDDLAAQNAQDADSPFTPAWQEKVTGVKASICVQIAREFAQNAIDSGGKSMVIMGAGINHWFNSDMTYRAIINLVLLTGCEGVSGGGWAHYVGQEKLRPQEGWATVAFANDWQAGGARQQNGTSFFYFASDQWKYDELDNKALKSPVKATKHRYDHPADYNQMAARLGWLPSYPQFDRSSLSFVKDYDTQDFDQIKAKIIAELKQGSLKFAIEDPDRAENNPKGLFIWRSNLFTSSGKGQEYMMKHMLGTENGLLAKANDQFKPQDMVWHEDPVEGKLDLVVDLDFRMVSTPMYSDIVLPAATWYEKEDLSSTDMHPFIHPFNAAINPLWESKSDWDIFKNLAKKFSALAEKYLPETQYDVKTQPLGHDSPAELAQPFGEIKDWKYDKDVAPVPGKTMPLLQLIPRDYTQVYDKFIALGPNAGGKVGADGISYSVAEQYESLKAMNRTYTAAGINQGCPKIDQAKKVADAILTLSSASNGAVAKKAWLAESEHTGVDLSEIAAGRTEDKMTFQSITTQPREAIPTPIFSSAKHDGERYAPFTVNTEFLVPFRTLTGRQQFYLDHEIFQEYGEQLTTYKPTLPPQVMGPKDVVVSDAKEITLRYMTPHGKWNIHTTYQDNLEMLTLFRGGPNVWLAPEDATDLGIKDNDWLEIYNRNGVVTARAVVSHRMPKGSMYMYHAQDMDIQEPLSTITGNRGGSHNAPTQIHIKPTQMVGGYAQLSYGFNYYGPIGNQRDLYVNVRKLEKVNWNED
ncbi:nitrate reductase, alpha chain [Agrilactobacillus composti DSM 18527 = JCM 14202]|uniref:nitrate reductase (quinone) n=1 Tax=Agrilactobacillus composti DSM 18527 = JCM 14202 TaxID=1423734 RepID=A0A0R1XS80_9LACO|nr:nitrate reductase, alpha chain [Agrilactobacillus composti DSM 18527 = JCM 14202]